LKAVVVLISAGSEWRVVIELLSPQNINHSPYGEWFEYQISQRKVIFVQSGVGKVSSAAAAQYSIDQWQPVLCINLGTCGGFAGSIQPGQIILANETMLYDLYDQMGNQEIVTQLYTTHLDISFLSSIPHPVIQARMISADRDLSPTDIPILRAKYQAIAADW
jgi:adenosylhomocysteine nucleosidase